jgi:TolB-like protein
MLRLARAFYAPEASLLIRIGDWTVRPIMNLVERNGTPIKLEPRAMDLLVYLAFAPNRVKSADELLREVWRGRVFDEGVVYKKINQLRRALGDDPRGGRFIETIPKRGYRLVAPVAVEEAGETNRHWRSGSETSVAVLPFVSIDGPDYEYFADGLTEELLSKLTAVPQLRVVARISSLYFKGKNEPVRTIGSLLGVRYVVTGSVRRSGNVLRVTVGLDDADEDNNLWSNVFERVSTDVFEIQDEIVSAIVARVEVTLRGASVHDP